MLPAGSRWDLATTTVARKREVVCGFCVTSRSTSVAPVGRRDSAGSSSGVRKRRRRDRRLAQATKGDPCRLELDSAMKRIGVLTMRWNCWRPRRARPSALSGRRRSRRSAATARPARVWPTACGGCSPPPGAWHDLPLTSFYAMTSGQHAEQPPAKRRGPKPAISDRGAAGGDREADLEASPWEGEGYRKVCGLGFGSVATSGLPASGCSDARPTICSRPRIAAAAAWRQSFHMTVSITHAPNLMWGTDELRLCQKVYGFVIGAPRLIRLKPPLHRNQVNLIRLADLGTRSDAPTAAYSARIRHFLLAASAKLDWQNLTSWRIAVLREQAIPLVR